MSVFLKVSLEQSVSPAPIASSTTPAPSPVMTMNAQPRITGSTFLPAHHPARNTTSTARAAHLCDPAPPGQPPVALPPLCNAPQDPGPGDFLHFDGSLTYQPTAALSATLSLTKERLRRYDTGRLAFDENIVSLRSTYQFSRFLFARGRVDFDSIASNVKGQFLLGYTPNPGTALYVGYNDDLNRRGFNPFSGQLEPGFRRNGRTFFIKMSYLFRKSF